MDNEQHLKLKSKSTKRMVWFILIVWAGLSIITVLRAPKDKLIMPDFPMGLATVVGALIAVREIGPNVKLNVDKK